MPACFSRPICRLALQMNDAATDDERQQLLPFVTRLACADTPEVEKERESYIILGMGHRFSFQKGLEVLKGALNIGRRADLLVFEEVGTRMTLYSGVRPRQHRFLTSLCFPRLGCG